VSDAPAELPRHPAERADTHELIRGRATIGDFEITVLTDGCFRLDGGAMFGVVPRTLWERRAAPDAQNRILLGTNTLVIRDGRHTVVVETGIGNKFDSKMRAIYGAQQLLPASFAVAGIRPDEVDVVINSHLHFDHCGWNTTLNADGSIVPTFPNAHYFAHRGEVDHGRLQLERDRMSYLPANYEPLIASGRMTLIEGPQTILPGISVDVYPGHTAHMLAIFIDSGGRRGCYISDLIPTSAHLDLTWVMGYDLDPLTTIEQRKRFYARAIPERWLVFFTHDHHSPLGYISLDERGKPVLRSEAGT
jgi:glyoxylase-like metal-dependent hydrolase (beta-lactamase superfamily II)